MWAIGLIMMAVMFFGMHAAGDTGHKGEGRKDVPQAVQATDHGHGQSSEGRHQMMHESGHGGQTQEGTPAESGDNDRRKPAPLPESVPPNGEKDNC